MKAARIVFVPFLVLSACSHAAAFKSAERRANRRDTVVPYEKFYAKHQGEQPWSGMAQDRIAWSRALDENTLEGYRGYLELVGEESAEQADAATASIVLLELVGESDVPVRARVAMLKQLSEDYEDIPAMTWQMKRFLEHIYFAKSKAVLRVKVLEDHSGISAFGWEVAGSSLYSVYGGVVLPGEVVMDCGGDTVRTLHSVPSSTLSRLARDKPAEVTCEPYEKNMLPLVGAEAFGEIDGRFSSNFSSYMPDKLSEGVGFTKLLGQYRDSTGAVSDLLEGAAQFAVDHPIATDLLVEGVRHYYDSKKR